MLMIVYRPGRSLRHDHVFIFCTLYLAELFEVLPSIGIMRQ